MWLSAKKVPNLTPQSTPCSLSCSGSRSPRFEWARRELKVPHVGTKVA